MSAPGGKGDHVVLIGFMGAGKSATAVGLARRLGRTHVDLDEAIVAGANGRTIAELFDTESESGVREREYRALLDAVEGPAAVIACGGGTAAQPRCARVLEGAGTIVYLRATTSTLRDRVGTGEGRPMLRDPSAFERLLAERSPIYERLADVTVDTDERELEDIVDEIASKLT